MKNGDRTLKNSNSTQSNKEITFSQSLNQKYESESAKILQKPHTKNFSVDGRSPYLKQLSPLNRSKSPNIAKNEGQNLQNFFFKNKFILPKSISKYQTFEFSPVKEKMNENGGPSKKEREFIYRLDEYIAHNENQVATILTKNEEIKNSKIIL